jgi:hypothetical protein
LLQRASFLRLDEEYYAEVAAGRAAASGSTALAALVWGSQLVRFCWPELRTHRVEPDGVTGSGLLIGWLDFAIGWISPLAGVQLTWKM